MRRNGSQNQRRGRLIRRFLGRLSPRWRFGLGIFGPIAVSLFSQIEFVQQSRCVVAELPLGIGQCEVMADLIAPAWALAIIPVAARLRSLVKRYGAPPDEPKGWFAKRFATRRRVEQTTRAARFGAFLIIIFAYTREWERFGQQPDAVWYALLMIATFAMLLIPVWWIRTELHARGVRYLSTGRWPLRADRFLFSSEGDVPPRWPHVLAFSVVTLIVAITVLGQFDLLLRGMHLPGDAAAGIGSLPSIFEFDLSHKPDLVIERVQSWRHYSLATGAEFGSPYSIVVSHVLVQVVATIPAYFFAVVTLALYAWRFRLKLDDSSIRRSYELVVLVALTVLVVTMMLDVLGSFFTWYVMDRAWLDPILLTDANVRLLWFFALARQIGLAILVLAGVLLLALAGRASARLRPALIAVRSEILLLVVFAAVVLMLPQTADVIRGWHVSHMAITLGVVVVLSMLVRWTSAANLRLQEQHRLDLERGDPPRPRQVRIPFSGGSTTTLLRLVGTLVVLAAIVQAVISATTGLQVGRGLLVPGLITVLLGLVGLALPAAGYVRGDRPVPLAVRRRVPRLLGAAVYVIMGVAVLKAAAPAVAYARHEDWYLFFALVPPAIGIYRIASRTTHKMNRLEVGFALVLTVLTATLLAIGNPELSPSALSFAGVIYAYGSLAYFNSYEEMSAVSRFSNRYLSRAWARPFVILAAFALAVTVVVFYVNPIGVAPRIGTIGMVVMAMMLLTLAGAGAVRFAELARPPKILAAFGIQRTPVVFLFVLWILLAPTVIEQSTNDIRVMKGPASSESGAGANFSEVWERWAERNLAEPEVGAVSDDRRVVPLLLVSSSGGGLRAATWTSFVLDCIFESTGNAAAPCSGERSGLSPLRRVAIMSGVSGGALGFAEYVAHVLDGVEGQEAQDDWVDEVLGHDYLAAPIGWLFFADLPRSLLGFGAGISNRSEVMERAWEAAWPNSVPGLRRGIAELWESHPEIPPMIFNGTSVNDACRFNVSALDADGASPDVPSCSGTAQGAAGAKGQLAATYDLMDFLCDGDDVALSTAAGMAARYPVVSASSRVTADLRRDCPGRADGTVFVVDGAYLEGSGSGTLMDAWEALSGWVEAYNSTVTTHCVVPFMVHIDNGYESPSVSANEAVPREILVPLLTTLNTTSGITAARAEAALAFEQPFSIGGQNVEIVLQGAQSRADVTSRYSRLVTRAHPGVQAPLGWTLSQASIDDLRDQLAIRENAEAFEEVRTWIDGDMRCVAS